MTQRPAVWIAAAVALSAMSAAAHADKPNYDRLNNMLEEKFAPPRSPPPAESTRSLRDSGGAPRPAPVVKSQGAPAADEAAPSQARREKYDWVKPDDEVVKKRRMRRGDRKNRGKQPDGWYDSIKKKIWGPSSLLVPSPVLSPFVAAAAAAPIAQPDRSTHSLVHRTGGAVNPAANSSVPVAKKNSYMIQLKQDVTEEQIQELLRKYDLTITKVIGALGVITVEQNAAPDDTTRGLESSSDPKEKLNRILTPQIIQDLRKEPAVDAAFVNTLIAPKALPRPSGAEVKIGDQSYAWRWTPGATPDGNWGLKAMRMPALWSLLDRHRRKHPDEQRPKIGVIDTGFTENANVKYDVAIGGYRPPLVRPDCETNHGTHVAGIIGAQQGAAPGVDGIVPDARLEAVAISAEFIGERDNLDADENWQAQAMLFSDVLSNTMVYLTDNLRRQDNLRVINVSLAYNFVARGVLGDADPDDIAGLKLHITEQASVIRTMARLVENEVLFVVAAGNDSDGLDQPLHTRWASPFAWAGTYEWASGDPVRNIIVVEAFDRDGMRAEFSNIGGHIAAPGVDIMSTLGGTTMPFGVCSGTSQAAPHVAALAALLFELQPSKTPEDVIAVIKSGAEPPAEVDGGAPRVDALQSAFELAVNTREMLADVDGNGVIDENDLKVFARQLGAIETAAATEAAFTEDLNGDGVVDDNECFFPLIDLNGDGQASVREAKNAKIQALKSDLSPIETFWPAAPEALRLAMTQTGLSARIAHMLVASADGDDAHALPSQCRRKDGALIAANMPPLAGEPATAPPTGSPSAGAVAETEAVPPQTGGERGLPPLVVAEAGTVGVAAPSADIRAEVSKGVDELKRENPELRVTINPATGLPSSISGFKPSPAALTAGARSVGEQTDEDTRRIVESFLSTSGLTAALPTRNKKVELEYTGRRKDPDFPGRFIANVEQRVDGVKVFGSSAKLTVESSLGVTRFQGATSAAAIPDTKPTVPEPDAISAARRRLTTLLRGSANSPAPPLPMGPNPDTAEATAELTVFDPALLRAKIPGGTRLAWMVTIDAFRLFVDAKSGEVFHYYRNKPTGLIRRIYDLGNGPTDTAVVDETGKPTGADVPGDAEQAFRYTGAVRDYFFLVFGRNSFDDNDQDGPNGGAPLESFVRYGTVRNAFWCPSKSYDCPKKNVMVFGPGYADAVDIVAHEMVHGIIAHEANLIYSDEPGAVNESIADIFAALIEFYAKGPSANWLIGENAPGFTMAQPLRNLAAPNLSDPTGSPMFNKNANFSTANRGQPDHYDDVVRPEDPICASTWLNDNGCVHFNSGILNKFAYLIAEGGTHRGMAVEGLGRMKLARLTYRTLTVNLNQTASLVETAEGYLQSCLDLTTSKTSGFTESDCNQVLAAQQAVGLIYGS